MLVQLTIETTALISIGNETDYFVYPTTLFLAVLLMVLILHASVWVNPSLVVDYLWVGFTMTSKIPIDIIAVICVSGRYVNSVALRIRQTHGWGSRLSTHGRHGGCKAERRLILLVLDIW